MQTQENNPLNFIIEVATGKALLVDGSISKQCQDALNEAYKKIEIKSEQVATESQANDEIMSQSIWQAISEQKQKLLDQGYVVGLLYGVNVSKVTLTDIIKVTEYLDNVPESEKEYVQILIDDSIDEYDQVKHPTELSKELIKEIEITAQAKNIPVIYSHQDLVKRLGAQ